MPDNKIFDWSKIILIDPTIPKEHQDEIRSVLKDMAEDDNGKIILEAVAREVNEGRIKPVFIMNKEDKSTGCAKLRDKNTGANVRILILNFKECSTQFYYNEETNSFFKASFNSILAHELMHAAENDNKISHDHEAAAGLAASNYVKKFGEPRRSNAYALAWNSTDVLWESVKSNSYTIPPKPSILVMSSEKHDVYDKKYISDKNQLNVVGLNFLAGVDMKIKSRFSEEELKKINDDMFNVIKPLDNKNIPLFINTMGMDAKEKEMTNKILNEKGLKLEGHSLYEFFTLVSMLAKPGNQLNQKYFEDQLKDFTATLPPEMKVKLETDLKPLLGK